MRRKTPEAFAARMERASALPPLGSIPDDVLLEAEAASAYTGIEPKTLANWRLLPNPPIPHVKLGHSVRYRAGAIKDVVRGNRAA